MFPFPLKQTFSICVHHIYLVALFLFQENSQASSIFQIKKYFVMSKLVSKALTNLMAHLIFLPLIDLNHCLIYVVYACTYTLELAEPCCHGERFQHCTCTLYTVDIMLFCLWMSPM